MGSPFVFLLTRAAAAATPVTICLAAVFWIAAVFWRRRAGTRGVVDDAHAASVAQPGFVDDAHAASVNGEATHPNSRADEMPDIFLSHSGKQKPFVENFYDALQNANHTAFFDKHTLPKGSPFPLHIIRAARGCKLGVVVLSEDFLTSKWPMLELEILVMQRDAHTKVLPLFYKLRLEDLKSPTNLIKWRRVWKEKTGQDEDKWERAIKTLSSFNGDVFVQGTSEITFIKNVVRHICKLVPSHILYDLSPIQGHQRLAQEVASKFEEASRQAYCMVGLYGVGGLGKTTVCKMMCNFYMSEYLGKSCLIEFPSDGDEKKIVQECKKALKELANLSDEHVLNNNDSFDKVVQLMKENLGRYDVFLAIDNVWESSLQAAKRILGVSFSSNTKILLTSRSEEVLKDLVGNSCSCVCPLPSPHQDEAFHIFQETFEAGDLKSLVNRKLLDSVLNTCFFSGNYHALALKALGQHVKRVCKLEGLMKIEDILSDILRGIVLENHDVEGLIRLNYVNLPADKQHMFLDIVVVVKDAPPNMFIELTSKIAHQWLSMVYKEFSMSTISKLIYELALDGLIQLENIDDKNAGKLIRVHDLYYDLAQKEVAKSTRFFTDRSPRSVEKIVWERLGRVTLSASHLSSHFMKELHQQQCPNLAVLCVEKIDLRSRIHLDLMPSLCVLKLDGGNLRSINKLRAATGLAVVHLANLRGLSNLDGLRGLTCLERLVLRENKSMKDVVGGLSPALKDVVVWGCGSLKRMPDLRGLTCLKSLCLGSNKSMKEVVGGLSPALKHVVVAGCHALKRMPDLSGLTCLKRLNLMSNGSMGEVGGENLSSTLKDLQISCCRRLRRFPRLNECVHLQILSASACFINNNFGSLEKLPNLQRLSLNEGERTSIERLMISGTHLQSLALEGCDSLLKLEVGCLPSNLQELRVSQCKALEEIGDLNALHRLEMLDLSCCPSLKKLGGVPPHLQSLFLYECGSLEESTMPDVSLIPQVFISRCGTVPNYRHTH